MRSTEELTVVSDPAWPELRQRLAASDIDATILPVEGEAGHRTLFALQVSAASTLGALALHTGGVVCDHGWLRMLGSGSPALPGVADANALPLTDGGAPTPLTIAYDVLGGQFAIDDGTLAGTAGEVCYFGPDTLAWTPTGGGHTAFVHWALGDGLADFYDDLRWPGWQRESSALAIDEGISIYPPPFTQQGEDLSANSRRAVPFDELLALYADWSRQLADLPSGQSIQITIED